jgi:hypothetical protein
MKTKNAAAKIGAVALSTMAFTTIWGWIAAAGTQNNAPSTSEQAVLAPDVPAPTPETVIRRMIVVRTTNADGTVTQRIVPESDYSVEQAARVSAEASRPVARSRGS